MARGLRIVLTHPLAWPEVGRGAERYVHELATALNNAGHTVHLRTSAPVPFTTSINDVPMHAMGRGELGPSMKASNSQQLRFAAHTFAALLPRGLDVWHANGLFDAAAASATGHVRPRLRTVFTIHGPIEPSSVAARPRRQAFALARRVDSMISVSERAAEDLHTRQRLDTTTISPGVDTDAFTPGGDRAPVPTVLYAGTLTSPRKNVSLLIEAVGVARGREPRLELVLAGRGELPPEAIGKSYVRHVGALDGNSLVAAYRSAWITALVSEREVFGLSVLEGLACGTPALVLDDGWGPASLVTEGTGVRVQPTPAAIAQGILEGVALVSDSATSERCRARAASFDWRRAVVPRMIEVYTGGR